MFIFYNFLCPNRSMNSDTEQVLSRCFDFATILWEPRIWLWFCNVHSGLTVLCKMYPKKWLCSSCLLSTTQHIYIIKLCLPVATTRGNSLKASIELMIHSLLASKLPLVATADKQNFIVYFYPLSILREGKQGMQFYIVANLLIYVFNNFPRHIQTYSHKSTSAFFKGSSNKETPLYLSCSAQSLLVRMDYKVSCSWDIPVISYNLWGKLAVSVKFSCSATTGQIRHYRASIQINGLSM